MIQMILFMIFIALLAYRNGKGIVDSLPAGVVGGLVLGFFVAFYFAFSLPRHIVSSKPETIKLVSFVEKGASQESFFLALDDVGDQNRSKFRYKTVNGESFIKPSEKKVKVYNEDRTDAFLIKTTNELEYSKEAYLLVIPRFMDVNRYSTIYEFHIPNCSIKIN